MKKTFTATHVTIRAVNVDDSLTTLHYDYTDSSGNSLDNQLRGNAQITTASFNVLTNRNKSVINFLNHKNK